MIDLLFTVLFLICLVGFGLLVFRGEELNVKAIIGFIVSFFGGIICLFRRNNNNVEIGSLADVDGLEKCKGDCNEARRDIDTARRNNTEIGKRLDDSIRKLEEAITKTESPDN